MQEKKITKTIYIAEDGEEFDNKYLCKKYELRCILKGETNLSIWDAEEVLQVVLDNIAGFVELSHIVKEG